MQSIQAGLPEVVEAEKEIGKNVFKFSKKEKWTCRMCLVKNKMKNEQCPNCHAPRPQFKLGAQVQIGDNQEEAK